MTEDRIYKELREKLSHDFVPVKPLEKSWIRAIWIFPVSFLCIVVTLVFFHLRPDYANFHTPVFWGLIMLQILVCYLVFLVSLKTCIPGSIQHPLILACAGLIGPAIFFAASLFVFRVSPHRPPLGQEDRLGLTCMSVIGMFGILILLIGYILVRTGLPFRPRTIGLLLGLGSGLTAEAIWRLHCPFSSWDHILMFHSGAVLCITVLGLAMGYFWERKSSRN